MSCAQRSASGLLAVPVAGSLSPCRALRLPGGRSWVHGHSRRPELPPLRGVLRPGEKPRLVAGPWASRRGRSLRSFSFSCRFLFRQQQMLIARHKQKGGAAQQTAGGELAAGSPAHEVWDRPRAPSRPGFRGVRQAGQGRGAWRRTAAHASLAGGSSRGRGLGTRGPGGHSVHVSGGTRRVASHQRRETGPPAPRGTLLGTPVTPSDHHTPAGPL